jgi:hypothetical protein
MHLYACFQRIHQDVTGPFNRLLEKEYSPLVEATVKRCMSWSSYEDKDARVSDVICPSKVPTLQYLNRVLKSSGDCKG